MTPQTTIIDRSLGKEVGRFKRACGSTDLRIVRNYRRMLTHLKGDPETLKIRVALRDGTLTIAEVFYHFQRHTLHELATGDLGKPLAEAFSEWHSNLTHGDFDGADCSTKHWESLNQSKKYLSGVSLKGRQTVRLADLPAVVRQLRDTLGKSHAHSFNHARAAALTFIRSTLTRANPLWLEVSAVERRKITKKIKTNPLNVEQIRNLFPSPESNGVDAIAWGMVSTGMLEKEYWGEWTVLSDRVRIHGTKRAGRDRFVPLVLVPTKPTMHPRTFTNKLRARTRMMTASDLRDTYSHWLELARIVRTRRRLYMGHGNRDVTDIYESHEVDAFLVEDAAAIRRFLKLPEPTAPLALVRDA